MTANEYWAGEFSDEFLDAQADLGDHYLEGKPEMQEKNAYDTWIGGLKNNP